MKKLENKFNSICADEKCLASNLKAEFTIQELADIRYLLLKRLEASMSSLGDDAVVAEKMKTFAYQREVLKALKDLGYDKR